jgi:hypothetical protein
MQLFNSALGSNDKELASRVWEKVLEEVRQIDPSATNSDTSRVMLDLTGRVRGIKEGGP